MPAPYDYSVGDVASPMQSFLQGLQISDALQQRQQSIADAERARAAEQQRLQLLQGFTQKIANRTATDSDFAAMMALDPKSAEGLNKSLSAYNTGQKKALFDRGLPIYAALHQNTPESIAVAKNELRKQIKASEESNPEQAKALQNTLDMIEAGVPDAAYVQVGSVMQAADPEAFGKIGEELRARKLAPITERRAAAEAGKAESEQTKAAVEAEFSRALQQAGLDEKNWNIKNLRSQIGERSARLKLDEQKVTAEIAEKLASAQATLTSLSESAQKLVNESATVAATSRQDAKRMNDLANQLEQLPDGWGKFTSLKEWAKAQYGGQDLRSALLGEYTRLANSSAIKAYRASGATGGFSDTDLQTALSGLPPSNASPKQLAEFMRGMAKMQDMDSALNNAKTDWLTENKGQLGRANKSFIAGDYSVKPGETYADFSSRVSADIAKRYGPKPSAVDLIPTGQPQMSRGAVAPTSPVSDVRAAADAILRGGR